LSRLPASGQASPVRRRGSPTRRRCVLCHA
jgi:hypothetical protein